MRISSRASSDHRCVLEGRDLGSGWAPLGLISTSSAAASAPPAPSHATSHVLIPCSFSSVRAITAPRASRHPKAAMYTRARTAVSASPPCRRPPTRCVARQGRSKEPTSSERHADAVAILARQAKRLGADIAIVRPDMGRWSGRERRHHRRRQHRLRSSAATPPALARRRPSLPTARSHAASDTLSCRNGHVAPSATPSASAMAARRSS
jgi:hypothetical protein